MPSTPSAHASTEECMITAKEAAELEQRRNDVRNFLEEEGGGLCACGGRGQASSGGANKRHVLLDQQLLALVDLLAGTKATGTNVFLCINRSSNTSGWGIVENLFPHSFVKPKTCKS
jgi:hypothetical protein